MKDLGYGKDYKYAHDYTGNFAEQFFLPDEIKNYKIYNPQTNKKENEILTRLKSWWKNIYKY